MARDTPGVRMLYRVVMERYNSHLLPKRNHIPRTPLSPQQAACSGVSKWIPSGPLWVTDPFEVDENHGPCPPSLLPTLHTTQHQAREMWVPGPSDCPLSMPHPSFLDTSYMWQLGPGNEIQSSEKSKQGGPGGTSVLLETQSATGQMGLQQCHRLLLFYVPQTVRALPSASEQWLS